MQYISPFHFILVTSEDGIDRQELLLAKKKLLAELELSDRQTIMVNGREFSKHDIISFFDELRESRDIAWHFAVYKDKALLRFLEEQLLETSTSFLPNPLYNDEAFINWISPYYATAFL
ncbi:MAG: hypothetical protein JST39_06365 [Bacteroidetes bacterium]|nr:hypothetical protein [Bacteroidota bacterium]